MSFRDRGGITESIVQYQFVLDNLHLLNGKKVLDIGIGPNPSLWYMLNATGFNCLGMDLVQRVNDERFVKADISMASYLRPAYNGIFCLDVLHSVPLADRAVMNMIRASLDGCIIFIAVPYSYYKTYQVGKTLVYSEERIDFWRQMIGDLIVKKYYKCWEDGWRRGERIYPEEVSRYEADMVCMAAQIPYPSEKLDCNYKLDDSLFRYYSPAKYWPQLKERYNWIISSANKAPVLDIGCSSGVACREISKKGLSVIGLDYSDRIIRIARAYGGNFIWGKAENLPFENNKFRTVIITETLEHVQDLDKTISEIDRVLRKGGEVIISVPNGGTTSKQHLRTFTEAEFRKLLPWQIIDFGKSKDWLRAKCVKLPIPTFI